MPKPYHHGELRDALIRAATDTLERGGSADISLRETARRAGVSPTATYRHFASKEALLAAVAEGGFADLQQRFAGAVGGLAEFGQTYVAFARTRPAMFRLMFGGAYSVATLSGGDAKIGQGAFQVLTTAVAHHAGLAPDDPDVLRRAVRAWSLVHGYAMLLLDDRLPDAAQSQEFLLGMLGAE